MNTLFSLLEATPQTENPVELLQAAAREHIPVYPNSSREALTDPDFKAKRRSIPEPEERPSIDSVIEEIMKQDWYKEQITERRVFDPKDGQTGEIECSQL